jgi:predicted nucleic acid-binding protein
MATLKQNSYFRANYLDASAVIKILVNEPSSSPVSRYFKGPHSFYMTSLCFAEAPGVLKTKYFRRKEITEKGYLNRSYLLTVWLREQRIKLDEVSLIEPIVFKELESIIKKYPIDTSDALQIITIKRGRFSNLVKESQSLLITADGELAKAASAEGLSVWDCVHETSPPRLTST